MIHSYYGPGWNWTGTDSVFNPVDIGLLFKTGSFDGHWCAVSVTGWLFKLLKPWHQSELMLLRRQYLVPTVCSPRKVDN